MIKNVHLFKEIDENLQLQLQLLSSH